MDAAVLQSRIKTLDSINEKRMIRGLGVDDFVGHRIVTLWTQHLKNLATHITDQGDVRVILVKEGQMVTYLYVASGRRATDVVLPPWLEPTYCEIQLWPTALYHCFSYEYSRIYKNPFPNTVELEDAKDRRKRQLELQTIIDENVLVPPVVF